jgi:hypothetical protein
MQALIEIRLRRVAQLFEETFFEKIPFDSLSCWKFQRELSWKVAAVRDEGKRENKKRLVITTQKKK